MKKEETMRERGLEKLVQKLFATGDVQGEELQPYGASAVDKVLAEILTRATMNCLDIERTHLALCAIKDLCERRHVSVLLHMFLLDQILEAPDSKIRRLVLGIASQRGDQTHIDRLLLLRDAISFTNYLSAIPNQDERSRIIEEDFVCLDATLAVCEERMPEHVVPKKSGL